MPSGKRSKQQRREAAAVGGKPPPVRSKGAPRGPRQASPRALAIGGGVLVLVVVGVVLALVLGRGGSSSGIPAGTPTIGRIDVNSLPGAAEINSLYKGIPQKGLYLGSSLAPVQMVMYIDLQCPVCQAFEVDNMPTIVRKYVRTGKVRIELKPWEFIGPDSIRGQAATIAASLQNKAFDFAGVLYDNQGTENTGWLNDSMLAQIAASVPGLNVPTLFSQRSSAAVKKQVSAVDASAQADNVQGTPTVLVGKNGTKPKDVTAPGNAPTLQEVESAIAAALGG
ncbi:MAG TPA: thioredoxin domain-containing protein [Gaiellaceae bacterium]|nr:thioredoxin domain-containing protein [Gaiellaceae bacterium]